EAGQQSGQTIDRVRQLAGKLSASNWRKNRPAGTTLVLHVLHYPEQVLVCPQTVWPMANEPAEELRLAGMLIEAAGGQVNWTAYPDQAAQELKVLIEAKLAGEAAVVSVPVPTILPLLEALQKRSERRTGRLPHGQSRRRRCASVLGGRRDAA